MRAMKKNKIVILIFVCSLLLCACTKQVETENDDSITVTEESQNTSDSNGSQRVLGDIPVSVAKAFQDVLLNKEKFFCIEQSLYDNKEYIIKFNGFLRDMPYQFTEQTSIERFAIIDMDGDIIPEVVLEIEDYFGYIILHYRERQIYGNFIDYRAMGSLNTNGAFVTMGGIEDSGIEKLYFIGDVFITNGGAYQTSNDTFYIRDITADKAAWDELYGLFNQSPKVAWYEYTEESVIKWIAENPSFTDIPTEISDTISLRQQYLDSLSYLVEQTYDLLNQNGEKSREDIEEYFNSRITELNKIYHLCQEKFSDEEWKELREEQQHWEENFRDRLNEELKLYGLNSIEDFMEPEHIYQYCHYGDIILRRTLELIDIYYDFDFYDSLY